MHSFLMRLLQTLFAFILAFTLSACGGAQAGGLNSYQSPDGRYGFLYPTGWTKVSVQGGPKVVFHDLINSDETLSLVVSKLGTDSDGLKAIGTPNDVGEKLIDEVIAPDGAGRQVELVNAVERNQNDHIFYDLEYAVHYQDRDRHEIATVAIDRNYLYTFAVGTSESRWPKVENLLNTVVTSFRFLI